MAAQEAEQVRLIFRSYLEQGSLGRLLPLLCEQGVVTKALVRDGVVIRGENLFGRGSHVYLLRNRLYVGEITFKGAMHAGEHPAIVDRELFDAMQEKLAVQCRSRTGVWSSPPPALLAGKLFSCGQRMSPTHAIKGGKRYRYYVNAALAQAIPLPADATRRVPAPELERAVIQALRSATASTEPDDCIPVAEHLDQLEVAPDQLTIRLKTDPDGDGSSTMMTLAWMVPTQARHRAVVVPVGPSPQRRTIGTETRATLLAGIAKGRRWLAEMPMPRRRPR